MAAAKPLLEFAQIFGAYGLLMNWADWTIIAIVGISMLLSIKRGFVKEAMSLVVWVAAFFIAVAFHQRLAVLMAPTIDSVSVRYILSFAALFVTTLVVGAMVKYLIGELIKMTGLSGADRLLGMAFGLARGVVMVMAILILVPMAFPANQEGWWQQSFFIPHFLLIEHWCKDTFTAVLTFFGNLF